MSDKEIVFNKILEIVKLASVARMQSVFPTEKIQLTEEPFPHIMPGEWVSVILLSSNHLRIFFKVFFDFAPLQKILSNRQNYTSVLAMEDNNLKDFMREYSNLVGGYIDAILAKLEIEGSLSLPLSLKGFDDFFFPFADNMSSFEKNWVLTCDDHKFYCACYTEILNIKKLDRLRDFILEKVDLKEGDVDFL